jgi:hypothetical protein
VDPADPFAERPPPRKGKGCWVALAVVGGLGLLALLAAVALIGLGVFFALASKELPAGPEERAALLTVDAFAELFDHEPWEEAESLSLTRWPDRSYWLEYEYDDGDLWLYASIDLERNPRDARGTNVSNQLMEGIVFPASGADKGPPGPDLGWGHGASSWTYVEDGETVGHGFAAAQGNTALVVAWTGYAFDEALEAEVGVTLEEFLLPHLERMAAWRHGE